MRAFCPSTPGRILTDLARFLDQHELATGGYSTPAQGAATSVWCATSPSSRARRLPHERRHRTRPPELLSRGNESDPERCPAVGDRSRSREPALATARTADRHDVHELTDAARGIRRRKQEVRGVKTTLRARTNPEPDVCPISARSDARRPARTSSHPARTVSRDTQRACPFDPPARPLPS